MAQQDELPPVVATAEDGRLSAAEVAGLSGLCPQQIDRLARLGVFPKTQRAKTGGNGRLGYRFTVAAVGRFLGEYFGPLLWTRTRVAQELGVSPARIGQLVARGQLIPILRPYGKRYLPDAVRALQSRRSKRKAA